MTPYTACAEAAASAAFQAHRAGAIDVWDRALEALEGVLAIGSSQQLHVESVERTEFA